MPSGPPDAGSDGDRLCSTADLSSRARRLRARATDILEATLTLDSITDSFTTILAQHRTDANTMTSLGLNPLDDHRAYVKLRGFRDLFDQKQANYAIGFPTNNPHPDYTNRYAARSFRALRHIIQTARAHDLEVTLIIYPYHAWFMDLVRKDGLWDGFDAALWRLSSRKMTRRDRSGSSTFPAIMPTRPSRFRRRVTRATRFAGTGSPAIFARLSAI